jgi:hypothetical protein
MQNNVQLIVKHIYRVCVFVKSRVNEFVCVIPFTFIYPGIYCIVGCTRFTQRTFFTLPEKIKVLF